MNALEKRGLNYVKECCDEARTATYNHTWPKELREFIADPKHGFYRVQLEEVMKGIASKLMQAEHWIDAINENGKPT